MLTPYQKVIEKLKNIEDDVGQMNVDRKRTEEGKKRFHNKCVSSQQIFLRKRALP